MERPPSQQEMSLATNAQGGTPNYIDETARTPLNAVHPRGGEDVPAYMTQNARYWEYR